MNSSRSSATRGARTAAASLVETEPTKSSIRSSRNVSAPAATNSDTITSACVDAASLFHRSNSEITLTRIYDQTGALAGSYGTKSRAGSLANLELPGPGELSFSRSRPAPVVQQLRDSLSPAEAPHDSCYSPATASRQSRRLAAALAAAAAVTDAETLTAAAAALAEADAAAMQTPAESSLQGDVCDEQQEEDDPRCRRRGQKMDGASNSGTLWMNDTLLQLRGLRASSPELVSPRSAGERA